MNPSQPIYKVPDKNQPNYGQPSEKDIYEIFVNSGLDHPLAPKPGHPDHHLASKPKKKGNPDPDHPDKYLF